MGEEKFRSTGETIIDGEVAYNKLKGLKESIAKEVQSKRQYNDSCQRMDNPLL